MALVSVYLADTERLYETCEAIDRSKEQFSNNPSVSSGNSSVGAITSKINELGNEIKEDYEKTSEDLRNYTNKVEANENKLKSKAVSVLENDSVVKNIPVMVTDSRTGSSKKPIGTFADSIKPRIENNVNVNMLNSLEVAQGIAKTYEGQAKTVKKEETLKDIADEFFENQRKSGVFPGSAINSQNNGAFASSIGDLNSVNKAIEVDPERIAKAKENTDKINAAARKKRFEEEKEQAYMINDISDSVGTVFGNPISVVSTIKKGVFSVAKIGGYAYSGVKSLFTGEKLTDVANETIEKISDAERKVDDELIGAKLFISEGVFSTAESLVKGVVSLSSDAIIDSSETIASALESITGEKYVSTAKEDLEKFLGTNWVHDKFSSFYEDNGYGNHLKNNLVGFDTQRDIGSAVGATIPAIAAGIATGGAGAIIVGGLSSTGSGTTSALQDGATLDEATNYGAAKGALSAATFGAGKVINALNIFGRGTVAQTLENAGARVLADTGLGAITSLADDVLKQLYVPRNKFNDKNFGFSSEEEWTNASFGDRFNAYFKDSGGWESIKNGAITGAFYSAIFEGASAVKEINSINSANKVYSDVKSNVEEVNNIKNQNMLNENNSIASNSLEDLYAQRKSIQEAYNNLDDQAKYFLQLKQAKDGIASGAITGAGLDNFINSGMAKAMYGDLNNQERLSLIDKMNQTQLESFFNQIGKTKAQAFLNKNSTYFTKKFFNTDSTNSTWTNNTSIITSSNPINGLQIQNPGSLTDTASSINNSLKYQRTGLFQYTLDYLKSNINKFSYKNTNTINGLNDEIKNNGLYHFTTAGDEILESGYIRASGVNASYGNKKTFFFNGVPDVGAIASNLDEVPLKAEAIKVNPTDEMVNSSKLKIRIYDDKAISYDGNVDLTNLESTKEYFCLFQEGDELVYKVVSKDYYDNYQNTTSGKKVEQLLSDSESVKAIKEDYYRSLSLNSTNASKGSATSISLIHESGISQTIDDVNKSEPKVGFAFLNALKVGKNFTLDDDYLHKAGKIIEEEPVKEIMDAESIPREREKTNSGSKIGFQFFATPKKGGNIISSLLNPTSRAVDTFFKDFDNGTDTYGADQNFGRKDTIYVTTGNSLGISRNKFYSYLSKRHPKLSLEELQRRWMISSDQRVEIYDPEEYISYIADRQAVLNNGVKDINKAIDTFESMTEKVPSDEYLKLQKFLMNKGMTRKESAALLYEVNSTGICSYASVANDILTSFRYNPREFKEKFGFSMYTYSDGKRVLNSSELMLDLYTYANSQSTNPTSILRTDANGELHINNLDTSSQKYMSNEGLKIVDSYLKSKDSSLSYNYKEEVITPTSVATIKSKIKTALKEGNVGLGINGSKKNRENADSINIKIKGNGVTRFLDESGKVFRDTKRWAVGDGHAVFVTGYNEQGVIVSSWGRRLIIPYEDLANSFFSIRTSVIGGIK